jgi:hypothetical protein
MKVRMGSRKRQSASLLSMWPILVRKVVVDDRKALTMTKNTMYRTVLNTPSVSTAKKSHARDNRLALNIRTIRVWFTTTLPRN